jgi:hypothetical protein
MALLAAAGKTQFDALSVGTHNGQVAIVPLDESNERNARLIAAAPDLLAALRDLLAKIEDRPEAAIAFPDEDLMDAISAVAAAEGSP